MSKAKVKACVRSGRSVVAIGEDSHKAKLTNHEVDLLRQFVATGGTIREAADKFELTYTMTWQIVKYKRRYVEANCWKIQRKNKRPKFIE